MLGPLARRRIDPPHPVSLRIRAARQPPNQSARSLGATQRHGGGNRPKSETHSLGTFVSHRLLPTLATTGNARRPLCRPRPASGASENWPGLRPAPQHSARWRSPRPTRSPIWAGISGVASASALARHRRRIIRARPTGGQFTRTRAPIGITATRIIRTTIVVLTAMPARQNLPLRRRRAAAATRIRHPTRSISATETRATEGAPAPLTKRLPSLSQHCRRGGDRPVSVTSSVSDFRYLPVQNP